MKKFLYTIAILAAATVLHSCVKDDAACFNAFDGDGAAIISIGIDGATRADKGVSASGYPGEYSDIRIYNSKGELVRYYTSLNDLPSEIWLVEGRYTLNVTLGVKESPTWDRPYYYGTAPFEIRKDSKASVNVSCKLQNTAVKVNFDNSIFRNFERYSVKVVAGSQFVDSPSSYLAYDLTTMNLPGYFIIPADDDTISFRFEGTLDDNAGRVTKTYEGIRLNSGQINGYCYTINMKYTAISGPKDENGYLSWNLKITVADEDQHDDIFGVNPAPRPVVEGSEWDIENPKCITADGATYSISATDKDIQKIVLSLNGSEKTIDCSTEGDKGDGVSIVYTVNSEVAPESVDAQGTAKNITLILSESYFSSLSSGEYNLNIKAYTSENLFGEATSKVRIEGRYFYEASEWKGSAEMKAFMFSGDVKIQYKKNDSDWQDDYSVADGFGGYSLNLPLEPSTKYEFRVSVDGVVSGNVETITTREAPQIYNAGFETWTGSAPLLPYVDSSDQWWDTGNHGSATLNKNVTTKSSDAHGGSYSAYLESQYVVIKFAAGNIFIGQYADTDGTDGVIAFGKPFDFTFRPKKLRFWYKSKNGGINRGSNYPAGVSKGDADPNEIYIMLCKMDGPHIVKTKDKNTFVNPKSETISYCSAGGNYSKNSTNDRTDGKVIASAVWNNTVTQADWKMVELDLTYYTEDEIPTYLMLTASASKYGDYFVGCDTNMLQLDDFELVY